ncbi:MAG TPA: MFS transporter [Ktedonosporobacter sp.]|jgi:DHA3 family tetracycline resistance protein-like MFS transporter|nr:MFS transporter [Ktedonosporobacter sp.]
MITNLRTKLGAYRVFLILEGTSSFLFGLVFTIAAVYRVLMAGLNPFQLVLVGTVLETTVMIFQIPTGLLADAFSRRLSVILGVFLVGLAFIVEGSFPVFILILVAQALRALGLTFTGGAEEAWIADEMGDKNLNQLFLRGSQAGLVGTLVGTLVGGVLASVRLNLPYLVSGVLFFALGIFLLLLMPEKNFQRSAPSEEQRNLLLPMKEALTSSLKLIRLRPVIITILCIAAFFGMASEGFDRLWQVHFLANFTFPHFWNLQPVVWFSAITFTVTLVSLASTEIIRKYARTENHTAIALTLFGITALLIVAIAVFGLAGNFYLALVSYLLAGSLRQTYSPIYTAWLIQNVSSKVRATVVSAGSQFDAIGQVLGGPIVGLIGTIYTLRTVMLFVAGILTPSLLLFLRSIRQGKAVNVDDQSGEEDAGENAVEAIGQTC